jgi:MFS family permease
MANQYISRLLKKDDKPKYFYVVFTFNLVLFMTLFYFPLYFVDIGLNGFQIGLLLGLFNITGLLFSFVIGAMTDRVKQKRLLFIGGILFSFFYLSLFFSKNFPLLVILFFVAGVSKQIILRTSEAQIYRNASERKGVDMAKYHFFKISPLLITYFIGAFIITSYGYDVLFIVSSLIAFTIFLVAFSIREHSTYKFEIKKYFVDIKRKETLALAMIIFIFCLHYGAEDTSYTLFLRENLGLGMAEMAFFLSVTIFFLLGGAVYTGYFSDNKKNIFYIAIFSMLVSGAGSLLFSTTGNPVLSFFYRCIHEIGDGSFMVASSIGLVRVFSKERMGGNTGFIGLVIILANFIGSLIFGPIGFRFGYQWPHIISGILSILAFLLIITIINRPTGKQTGNYQKNNS